MVDLIPNPSPSLLSENTNSSTHHKRRYNNNTDCSRSKNNGRKNHIAKDQNKKGSVSNGEEPREHGRRIQGMNSRRDKSHSKGNKKNTSPDIEGKRKSKKTLHQNYESKSRHKTKTDNDGKKSSKDSRISIDNAKKELSVRRDTEINQCTHVLSNRNFKLFKRGQYVTSYGFTRNQKLLGIPNCKFILNIPLDYPRSPLKLQYGKSNIQQQEQAGILEEKLERLTKNFNRKSSQLLHQGEPIVSQLNYLVEKADILSKLEYKSIDKHEKAFYDKFT